MTNKQEIALLEEIDRLNERILNLEDELGHLEHVNDKLKKNNQELVKDIIKELEDEYEHYRTVDKERASYIYTDLGVYKEILKDLKRMEQLEKENNELKEWNKKYLSELERWGYPETPIHISIYKKLTKAIEILKDTLNIELGHTGSGKCYIICLNLAEIDKEQEELLKEVLE